MHRIDVVVADPGELAPHPARRIVIEAPSALYRESLDHMEELCRELQIIALGAEDVDPAQGVDDLVRFVDLYEPLRPCLVGAGERSDTGEDTMVHVELVLRPGDARSIAELVGLLVRADEVSRAGALLTLPAPAHITEFRRRFFGLVIDQLGHTGRARGLGD